MCEYLDRVMVLERKGNSAGRVLDVHSKSLMVTGTKPCNATKRIAESQEPPIHAEGIE